MTSRAPIEAELLDSSVAAFTPSLGRLHLHVVIDSSRAFGRHALEEAVGAVAARLPVLGSRFERRFWRDRWVPAPELGPAARVEVRDPGSSVEEATLELIREELDPSSGWPWAVTEIPTETGSRLVITVLHQVADGAGSLAVARELGAQLLDAPRGGGHAPADRGLAQVVRALRLRQLPVLLLRMLGELARPLQLPFLTRTPLAMRRGPPATPRPVFRAIEIDVGESSELRRHCRLAGATVNDALVAALAMLVASLGSSGRLGSYFTVDLRRYLPEDVPRIANLSGVDAVVLPRGAAASFEQALAAVCRLTARRKRQLAGLPFILAQAVWCAVLPHSLLRIIGALAGRWIGQLLTRGLVVTNIGPMDRALAPWAGVATRAMVIGPFLARVQVPVITAASYRDRLTIALNGHDDLEEGELQRVASLLGRTLDAAGPE